MAGKAGVVCSVPALDYGIDLTLRAVDEGNGFIDAGVLLDVQLKSTTAAVVTETDIGFDLRVPDYDRLRATPVVPRVLVVLVLPPTEADWVTQTPDELTLRHAAYWLSLRGMPPTASTASARVHLPRANLFTPDALTAMIARIRAGGTL